MKKQNVYAKLKIKTNSFQRTYFSPNKKERENRFRDLFLYQDILERLKVNTPKIISSYMTEEKNPSFTIISKKVRPHNFYQGFQERNALDQIVLGTSEEKDLLTRLCLIELIKIIKSLSGSQPVGYDISPQNFIYGRTDKSSRVYAVDIYPPRLGFDGHGIKSPNKLLVNYPEYDKLKSGDVRRLRRAYYTKEGNIEHFLVWFIASRHVRDSRKPSEVANLNKNTIDMIKNILTGSGLNELSDCIDGIIGSTSYQDMLEYRLPSAKKFWKSGVPKTALCLAAAGKGRRARKELGQNKLTVMIHDKPLISYIIEAFVNDMNIGHVVASVRDTGNDVSRAIRDTCNKLDLEFTLVKSSTMGVGGAFYDAVRVAPEGGVILTVGDTLAYDYLSLLSEQATKGCVLCNSVDWKKRRTERVGNKEYSLVGSYYLNKDARKIMIEKFDEIIRKPSLQTFDKKNSIGEYRFSWLFNELRKQGVEVENVDIGSVAEINYSSHIEDMRDIIMKRLKRDV